jgi:hypothetical protein
MATVVVDWLAALDELLGRHRPRRSTATIAVSVGCSPVCSLRALVDMYAGRRHDVVWSLRCTPGLPSEPLEKLVHRRELEPALLAASGITLLTRQLTIAAFEADGTSQVRSMYVPPLLVWREFVLGIDPGTRTAAVETFGILVGEGMTVLDALVAAPELGR